MRVKFLSLQDALKLYPSKAFYDLVNDEIYIPTPEDLWLLTFAHEYVHHLRRKKFTAKLVANTSTLLIFLSLFSVMTLVYSWMAYLACTTLLVLVTCYFYEEVIVEKKLLKEMIKHETFFIEEDEKEIPWQQKQMDEAIERVG